MKIKSLYLGFLLVGITYSSVIGQQTEQIDYPAFTRITQEVAEYRSERLIDLSTFKEFSQDPNTIILDTRSRQAYDAIHVVGAIHINFSDFTEGKLSKLIPDKATRILIYCNNNFVSDSEYLVLKSPPLALNIPTFINLYGYGYKNIYELKGTISEKEEPFLFVRKNDSAAQVDELRKRLFIKYK